MAKMNVTPTRVNLKTLKSRLATSIRGHKLLKDKLDEMIRRYSALIQENIALRQEVETLLSRVFSTFAEFGFLANEDEIYSKFLSNTDDLKLRQTTENILNITFTDYELENCELSKNYALATTPKVVDDSIGILREALPKLLKLSSMEKKCQILSFGITQTKRRVNALELVIIPDLQDTIKYIVMKIDETERANQIRLIKTKENNKKSP